MLIDQATLARIADGSVTLAFRRWKRPTVKADGTLLTSIGQLRVTSLDAVEPDDIGDSDARAAGYEDAEVLRAELAKRKEGSVYRIGLRVAGADPRVELRSSVPEVMSWRRSSRASTAGPGPSTPSGSSGSGRPFARVISRPAWPWRPDGSKHTCAG